MAYYNNPYITGRHNPLYKTTNRGFGTLLFFGPLYSSPFEKVDETIIFFIPLGGDIWIKPHSEGNLF